MDIQFEQSSDISIGSIVACADDLAAEFPSREEIRIFKGEIRISAESVTSVSTEVPAPTGLMLRSADGKWVTQLRLDGFSLSRLEPYTTWNELKARAQILWSRYRAKTNSTKISRIALRYINRIALPPGESFETTFKTTFSIAENLPQAVAGFLLRFVVPFENEKAFANVTQALPENSHECIFDLDTFAIIPECIADEIMWMRFEELRNIKNRVFFESLTPAALGKFE